jgi:hypothetical protein
LKKFVFVPLSLLLLLILIPGCVTVQQPASLVTPPAGQPSILGTPRAVIEFTSNPSAINSGGTSTLLWNVTGANSVTIDQGIGLVSATGSRVIAPAMSTIYTISATNSAGTVTSSAVTTVNSASPQPVIMGFGSNLNSDGTSTLWWNVSGANSVSIDQGIGQVSAAGTMLVSPATSTVYTISAANYTGTVSRSAVTEGNPASPIDGEYEPVKTILVPSPNRQ